MADGAPAFPQRAALSGLSVGLEIVNAWAWMLARSPRLARALEATPGASATFGEILAGFDVFHRRYGIVSADEMRDVERKVTYVEASDLIIIRQTFKR
jgi:hypothetical protein